MKMHSTIIGIPTIFQQKQEILLLKNYPFKFSLSTSFSLNFTLSHPKN